MSSTSPATLPADFTSGYSFPLDDYQVQACRVLEAGSGVLVAAPTGAGKTVVGEYAVWLALRDGTKCFYTTPIKALSNQKYHDLVARHGADQVGLLTGDTSINGEAQVVVMTTEVLRNMMYAGSTTLTGLSFVVMDEVHYLADRFRGPVWEEVIIGLPESVRLVCLSATVSNAEEFGDWLDEVRGGVQVVLSERRPVPLFQHVMVGRRILDLFAGEAPTARELPTGKAPVVNPELVSLARSETREQRDDARRPLGRSGKGKRTVNYGSGNFGGASSARIGAHRGEAPPRRRLAPSRSMVAEALARARLLPAIVFVFSRQGCEAAVRQLLGDGVRLTTQEEANRLRAIAEEHLSGMDRADLAALGHASFMDALTRGIAAHHAGILPAFKAVVEQGFSAGLIKLVFATETLALGINMPARTVVLEKLVKYNGETHADITPGEYTQLTGRAGRRGIDVDGHAVVLWQPGMDPRAVAGLASRRTYPLRSSFTPTYNMAVNMVRTVGRDQARELLGLSFAQFQTDRSVVAQAKGLARDQTSVEDYLKAAQCELGDFAEYARLREDISRLEADLSRLRKAQRHAESGATRRERSQLRRRQPPGGDADLADQIDDLRARMRAHPCHACPDRETHARFAERAIRLERDSAEAARRAISRSNSIAIKFDKICGVLTSLGYLDEDGTQVTLEGARLARIYCELDLVVAECIRDGVFDDLDAPQLAAVLSSVLYESRMRDPRPARMPDAASERAQSRLRAIWREVGTLEQDFRLDTGREPDIGFAEAAFDWCQGGELGVILSRTGLPAGDFVRWVRQVVDLAGQLANALGPGDLRRRCRELITLMRRGVVNFDVDED